MNFQFFVNLNEDKIDFIKKLTGIKDTQEAIEHFGVTCLEYYLEPNVVLDAVEKSIFEGFTLEQSLKK
jgi:hypothetical protein